ncbi:MAG: hypothetical protein ACOYON_06265 [Fimbriimonas sp.]
MKDIITWLIGALGDFLGVAWIRATQTESKERVERLSAAATPVLAIFLIGIVIVSSLLAYAADLRDVTTVDAGGYKVPLPLPAYMVGSVLGLVYVAGFHLVILKLFGDRTTTYRQCISAWCLGGSFWLATFGVGVWILSVGADLGNLHPTLSFIVVAHALLLMVAAPFMLLINVTNAFKCLHTSAQSAHTGFVVAAWFLFSAALVWVLNSEPAPKDDAPKVEAKKSEAPKVEAPKEKR